jgi:hypothetical protein
MGRPSSASRWKSDEAGTASIVTVDGRGALNARDPLYGAPRHRNR